VILKQSYQKAMSQSPLGTFGFALGWWLFIFNIVLVPLAGLYQSGSLLKGLSALQIIECFSSMIVLFAILALTMASVSLVLANLCNMIGLHGNDIMNKVNAIIGIFVIIAIFSDYSWQLAKILSKMTHIISNYKLLYLVLYLLFILLVAIIIIWKDKSLFSQIKTISNLSLKLNVFVVIFCATSSLIFIIFSSYINQMGNGLIAAVNKDKLRSYPNIIILTFDAMATKHASLYGYHRNTTPNLDSLAQESYVFDNMYASSNWTTPSVASLMTGKHPYNHRVINLSSYFVGYNKIQNLPLLLKNLGYETGVVWSNAKVCPWNNNLRGFDKVSPKSISNIREVIYESGLGSNPWLTNLIYVDSIYYLYTICRDKWLGASNEMHSVSNETPLINDASYSFSKAQDLLFCMKRPFFLWVHIYPPHSPYLAKDGFLYSILKEKVFDNAENYIEPPVINPYSPKDQYKVNQLSMRYDENICYADYEFEKFSSFLREQGLFDDTILIVSADHGEMFERGFCGHGGPYLYQPLIHIPLIIHLPGQSQGKRIGANVSQVDIAPTILDLVGAKPPEWMDGKSILETLTDNNRDTGTKFSMALGCVNSPPNFRSESITAIRNNYKLIKYLDWNRYELYDLRNDCQEQINLITMKPDIFNALKSDIDHIPQ
jgi:arylsulfatase A-like enzyme